jgi:hypothetical protein
MSYAPNYAWVGAPTVYNGTGHDAGDSGRKFHFQFHLHEVALVGREVHKNKITNFSIAQPSKT